MICPRCGKTSPEYSKFCIGCGVPFSVVSQNEFGKRNNTGLIVIICVLAAVVLGMGGYILGSREKTSDSVPDVAISSRSDSIHNDITESEKNITAPSNISSSSESVNVQSETPMSSVKSDEPILESTPEPISHVSVEVPNPHSEWIKKCSSSGVECPDDGSWLDTPKTKKVKQDTNGIYLRDSTLVTKYASELKPHLITTIPKGTSLTVLAVQGSFSFVEVSTTGQVGWVTSKHIK